MRHRSLIAWIVVLATGSLPAVEFRANRLFSEHMVLQRGKPMRVFGVGPDNAAIKVSLGSEQTTAKVANGEWTATLPALPAGGPHMLIIEGPKRIEFPDVWIGDVWVCSGQSNMRHELKNIPEFVGNRDAWSRPKIRLIRSAKHQCTTPASELVPDSGYENGWRVATADLLNEFSATRFYFGAALQRELNVPIGLIDASVGATNIELWMDATLLRRLNPNVKIPTEAAGTAPPPIITTA